MGHAGAQTVVRSEQLKLSTSLLSLVTPPPTPASNVAAVKPGRPARALIARILLALLARGDSKGLFDLAQALLKGAIGNEYKGAPDKEKEWRIACAYCLGEIYAVHGSQVSFAFFNVAPSQTPALTSRPFLVDHEPLHRDHDRHDSCLQNLIIRESTPFELAYGSALTFRSHSLSSFGIPPWSAFKK